MPAATETRCRFRLLHDGSRPIHDTGEPYVFGLQSGRDVILEGRRLDDGRLAFDFELRVKGAPGGRPPVFLGPRAQGPADGRFVYLSWKASERPGFINRIKAPLGSIGWELLAAAQAEGARLVADATGRRPHDPRPFGWSVQLGG